MKTTFEYRVTEASAIAHKRTVSDGVSVAIVATMSSSESAPVECDVYEDAIESTFMSNYECWNNDTNFLSTNNYDSPNFKAIVDMGEVVVPRIYKIIKEQPHPIVHALDLIYPGHFTYKGNVSLNEVCQAWITILQITGRV